MNSLKIVAAPLRVAVLAPLLLGAASAYAARPMITDDARVVDPKACQVESWARRNQDGTNEFWAQPACNFTGNLELTLGGAITRESGGATHASAQVLQGKTLFKPLETNGWGAGLVLGTVRDPRASAGAGRDWYGFVPMSFSFAGDRFVLHTNLGWQRDQGTRRSHVMWGVGSETRLTDRSFAVMETFGAADGRPHYQVGVRYWLVPERVQVDTTYGNRFGGGGDRWISVGLRLLSPAFLP
ncbi:hypothetical protein [Diaphorobacter aerolatus]|uniref:Transporter n=1 Tax=Diaphorobacter aerolatus TaxID=1288495 RepID=A0A7H0GHL8_9BURK|nr:hypothetical protein [Diaphorobacter aerolatus]QNP47784.1 hypothetical protein H9K75_16650 [Diaphorobacter aerolatus]